MGEGKAETVEKKVEEKKPEEGKKKKKNKNKENKKENAEKPESNEKPKEEAEKKSEGGGGGGEKKDAKDEQPLPPPATPPPPSDIVLKVFMHCEGCARKVRRCLKGFDGVEEVTTDCKTHKVVVKGEKADPLKVLERLQKKSHRQVELLSPIPPPKPPVEEEEAKKPDEKEAPKPQEIKQEPKVISVVLKVHMHCEACSLEIKKRIERMKEVQEAIPDLKNSLVIVKGTFDPPKLVEYVYKRTGKHAILVKQDPPEEKKEDDNKGKDGKDEKKQEKKGDKGKKAEAKEKGEEAKVEEQKAEVVAAGGGGEGGDGKAAAGEVVPAAVDQCGPATAEEGAKVVEVRKDELQYYPPRYAMEMNAYPPQMFSDENPNACSVM